MIGKRQSPSEKIRIEGDRKTAIETGRNRLMVAGALFTAAFVVIGIRVVDVSVFSDNAEPRYTRSITKDEKNTGRADIVDRNGILMATSLNTASLFANPRLVLDPEQAAFRHQAGIEDFRFAVAFACHGHSFATALSLTAKEVEPNNQEAAFCGWRAFSQW